MLLPKLRDFFTSLRLTVVLLVLLMVLVLAGTLAQVSLGLYRVQSDFFRSFFVLWRPWGGGPGIPVFPGGYLLGSLLMVNLLAVHFFRFGKGGKDLGIWLTHGGLILLLAGQALSGILSVESVLHLRDGETKSYSESQRRAELAVLGPGSEEGPPLWSAPDSRLRKGALFADPRLPFTIQVERYYDNSVLSPLPEGGGEPPASTMGLGARSLLREAPRVTALDRADLPGAVLRLGFPDGSSQSWLVSEEIGRPQTVRTPAGDFGIELRRERYYPGYSLGLLAFRHEVYPGSSIPRDYSSRVLLSNPGRGEKREVLIQMNRPLRYDGSTYYQAGFDSDNRGSVIQVMRNPVWIGPYLSVLLVGLGLAIQFGSHLLAGLRGRRAK